MVHEPAAARAARDAPAGTALRAHTRPAARRHGMQHAPHAPHAPCTRVPCLSRAMALGSIGPEEPPDSMRNKASPPPPPCSFAPVPGSRPAASCCRPALSRTACSRLRRVSMSLRPAPIEPRAPRSRMALLSSASGAVLSICSSLSWLCICSSLPSCAASPPADWLVLALESPSRPAAPAPPRRDSRAPAPAQRRHAQSHSAPTRCISAHVCLRRMHALRAGHVQRARTHTRCARHGTLAAPGSSQLAKAGREAGVRHRPRTKGGSARLLCCVVRLSTSWA
jgi:hypothetical protein